MATGILVLLGLCLFGGTSRVNLSNFSNSFALELLAIFRNASVHRLMFFCIGVYFFAFTLLRQHWAQVSFLRIANPIPWVTVIFILTSVAFLADYQFALSSTQSLALFGGAVLGSGLAAWREWIPARSAALLAKVTGTFVVLLFAGTLASAESFLGFQYQGQQRLTGLWDNPNTFGMLMGCGTALAMGVAVQGLKFKVQSLKLEKANIEHSTSNAEHRMWSRALGLIKMLFFVAAAGVMLFGLIKSYSRGAWLGAAIGIAFLIWNWMKGNLSCGWASVLASRGLCETGRLAGTLAPPDENNSAHLTAR